MNMLLKKKQKQKTKPKSIKNRKKHVETMFLTHKTKKHPFYYKSPRIMSQVCFNEKKTTIKRRVYTLKFIECGYLNIGPLKAIMRLYKWFIKAHNVERIFKLKLFAFPDFVLTSKPKDMRMGKGKGGPDSKVAIIKKGQIFIELRMFHKYLQRNHFLAISLLEKLGHKLPFKSKIALNNW